MKPKTLAFPHKKIRSQVIADYVRQAGYRGVVVFTCGNAAQALRDEGLEVTEVGPRGDLKTEKWWTMSEIHKAWPDLFDATSGHLAVPIMGDIAKAYKVHLGELKAGRYLVPSGSGETICCLRIAYPLLTFEPTYDDSKPETSRHAEAPLNPIVDVESLPESDEEKFVVARMMETYGQLVSSTPVPANKAGSPVIGLLVMALAVAIAIFLTTLAMR